MEQFPWEPIVKNLHLYLYLVFWRSQYFLSQKSVCVIYAPSHKNTFYNPCIFGPKIKLDEPRSKIFFCITYVYTHQKNYVFIHQLFLHQMAPHTAYS